MKNYIINEFASSGALFEEVTNNLSITYSAADYTEFEPFIWQIKDLGIINSFANEFKHRNDTEYCCLEKVIEHKLQDYLYSKDMSRRRLFYVDSECISNVQILPQNKCLTMNAYLRSSDLDRLLYNDLAFLCKLYCKALEKLNHLTRYEKYQINIIVACMHKFNYENKVEFKKEL